MTKEEVLKQIEELKKYIEEIDQKAGYKDDEIFLLSSSEYEEYKKVIPKINCWWWLRSPGFNHNLAMIVFCDGSTYCNGYDVSLGNVCVRPALRLKSSNFKVGDRILKYSFPWIVIDEKIAIAEFPIGFKKFDGDSNDYEISYIRKWLREWKENR